MTTPATAKIFENGSAQAVRLPKSFQFEVDEVEILRRGDEVICANHARACPRQPEHVLGPGCSVNPACRPALRVACRPLPARRWQSGNQRLPCGYRSSGGCFPSASPPCSLDRGLLRCLLNGCVSAIPPQSGWIFDHLYLSLPTVDRAGRMFGGADQNQGCPC